MADFALASFNLFNHDDVIFFLVARNCKTDSWELVVKESREGFSLFLSS